MKLLPILKLLRKKIAESSNGTLGDVYSIFVDSAYDLDYLLSKHL